MTKLIIVVAAVLGVCQGQDPAPVQVLTLDTAIREAVDHNLDLAADRYNIAVAEARQITAALRPNPVLTISGQSLDLLGARFNAASPAGPNQFNAHTDFVFERGSKRTERIRVAAADRNLTELELQENIRRLILDVQAAFVDVQQSADALTLAEDNLRSLAGIVQVNEARVKSGDLAPVELERSRVAASHYDVAVEQARMEVQQSKTRLAKLLGRTSMLVPFSVSREIRRETLADTPETIRTRALEKRPDLVAIRRTQARSSADLRLQLANGKVDYVIGSEYTYQRAYGMGGNSLGFSLSVPLPVFNKNQGEIARAEQQIKQAKARIAALEAAIANEVEIAYRQYDTNRRLLENIESQMLQRSKTVRDVTEYSYRRGEATLVEFLDAQRAFNDTVQSYNQARANFARSLYLIDSVSGLTAVPEQGGNRP